MNQITLSNITVLMKRQGLSDEFKEQLPLLLWPQIAGTQMTKLTEAVRVRQGILYLEATNHVVAQQLTLLKDAYIKKLNEALEDDVISDLRFRVAGKKQSTISPQLDDRSLLEIEKLDSILDEIEDDKLRASIESMMRFHLRINEQRKVEGGTICSTCGVYHDGEGQICYHCRVERNAK
jgi:hypothetical protein